MNENTMKKALEIRANFVLENATLPKEEKKPTGMKLLEWIEKYKRMVLHNGGFPTLRCFFQCFLGRRQPYVHTFYVAQHAEKCPPLRGPVHPIAWIGNQYRFSERYADGSVLAQAVYNTSHSHHVPNAGVSSLYAYVRQRYRHLRLSDPNLRFSHGRTYHSRRSAYPSGFAT